MGRSLKNYYNRFRKDNAKIAEFIEQKSTPERTNSLTLEQKVVLAEHATIWQDRTVRFAQEPDDTALMTGEEIILSLSDVEDVRGATGSVGMFLVTPLRIIWRMKNDLDRKAGQVDLSVGLDCTTELVTRRRENRAKGKIVEFDLWCVYNARKFQFIFHVDLEQEPRLSELDAILKAFRATRLQREMKISGNLSKHGDLILLPGETLITKMDHVTNLANDRGGRGFMSMTNIRMTWQSEHNPTFNMSIPLVHLLSIGIRNSRYGEAIVIKTSPLAGSYLLGFKLEPGVNMQAAVTELRNVWKTALARPDLGARAYDAVISHESNAQLAEAARLLEEDHVTDFPEARDALMAYVLDPASNDRSTPIYCAELGLAVEPLKVDATLEELWAVI